MQRLTSTGPRIGRPQRIRPGQTRIRWTERHPRLVFVTTSRLILQQFTDGLGTGPRCSPILVESRSGAVGLGRPCVLLALSVASARVSDHVSVSTPRSANRTCRSPASGSPTRVYVPFAHRG